MNSFKIILLALLSLSLVHCSSKKKQDAVTPPAPPQTAAPAIPLATPQSPGTVSALTTNEIKNSTTPTATPIKVEEKKIPKELEDLKNSIKKADELVKKEPDHGSKPHAHTVGPVPSEKALGWLKNGNTRFQKGFFRKDGASKKDVERLSKGQSPHSIILSCSDSRVPPEVIFDQKLGEVFVVRAIGPSIDNASIASIEYAITHLGSNLLVVMGHTSCGAVTTAFNAPVGGDAGSPYLTALVSEIQPRIAQRMKGPASEHMVQEGWDNTKGVSQSLLEKSKIIRDAVKSGSLRVETALYHLKSGQVEWANSL